MTTKPKPKAKKSVLKRAPPAPKLWKVVLTKLVSEHETEAQARAAFTSAQRGLRIGEKLVLVKDRA